MSINEMSINEMSINEMSINEYSKILLFLKILNYCKYYYNNY